MGLVGGAPDTSIEDVKLSVQLLASGGSLFGSGSAAELTLAFRVGASTTLDFCDSCSACIRLECDPDSPP